MDFYIFEKNEKQLYKVCWSLAIGVWFLYLSSAYRSSGGNIKFSILLFPQNMVFIIFGIFQAYNFYEIKKVINEEYTNHKGFKEPAYISYIRLIADSLIYTSFYTIVLFPISGIGIVEYVIVAIVIFFDFLYKVVPKIKSFEISIGQSPILVLSFGVLLFLIKIIVFYLFPDNIYNELFVGNSTARWLIAIIGGGGIILLLSQLKTRVFGGTKTANRLFTKIIGLFVKLFTFVGTTLCLICSPIVLLGITAITIIGGLFFIESIKNDIIKLLEPFLQKILTTGENKVQISNLYQVFQMISFVLILFHQLLSYFNLRKKAMEVAHKKSKWITNRPDLSADFKEIIDYDIRNNPILFVTKYDIYKKKCLEANTKTNLERIE
ncbi:MULTISPECIES: hypothetical protein [Treponema]|uniref:Uncharacterized protein n=1 Tax=Treponema denticola (strain ATCC 35405 / DSM 14222 / CIP 103919 / JCM 8153 / KCTC 15104) TaxID=243275 RepID=Q73MI0_TREDE|nr:MULTISPECIES: hypothetical protein [Treponema]AAS12045.1 hypothetical protein TDE_1528 [Treponema denticola ATCC 35405]EMB37403.1 hypothetical protein HMPREF9735_01518 [Treponema denticola ATCC 33521]EMB41572.1 hypothetical protein HMPREF9721_00316 [Treponema denticola ATCC 35404]HCY96294.1 hypothetical protein [Treponema sp.]